MRPSALVQYLRHGFIRSPDTIFQEVRELRPAHFLRYSQGELEIRPYWSPHSSVIVAAMRDLGETDIHSFAIGFEEASFDESPFAKQVADYLNTVHHESRKALQAGDLLFDLVRHYGQPYGDSSAIPTWYLCQETRGHVTVALSGDGGDELFCGYRRYVARRLRTAMAPSIAFSQWVLLDRIVQTTAMSISAAFKDGLRALESELDKEKGAVPYMIYELTISGSLNC